MSSKSCGFSKKKKKLSQFCLTKCSIEHIEYVHVHLHICMSSPVLTTNRKGTQKSAIINIFVDISL